MIVESVSPTPFALIHRAKQFEYREADEILQAFSAHEHDAAAITGECRRVLECISTATHSLLSPGNSTQDPSWSRFEDIGFSSDLQTDTRSRTQDSEDTTIPSWAEFLSSGFTDKNNKKSPAKLLPSQKLVPAGDATRMHSSESYVRNSRPHFEDGLEPVELASITRFSFDNTFWWVWMTSLGPEETMERKAMFSRCVLVETGILGDKWLVIEELVKGVFPYSEEGAYVAEKKSKFSWTKFGRLRGRK
jgi:hypothetical protein